MTLRSPELTRALEEEAEERPVAQRPMTHPGVGVLTALALELVAGTLALQTGFTAQNK